MEGEGSAEGEEEEEAEAGGGNGGGHCGFRGRRRKGLRMWEWVGTSA